MASAFGLYLRVDPSIEAPGIADLGEIVSAGEPLTRVRLDPSELERRWRPLARQAQRMRELGDGSTLVLSVDFAPAAGYLLCAPGLARILVTPDGAELLCDPEPHSAEWATLLTAQALPLAATLRGLEVLHASGVVPATGALAGRAVLISGPQGAGKSSLAAALLRRGAALLSDDTVAVEMLDGALVAHGGATLLQLREDEHKRLSARERDAIGVPAGTLGKQRLKPHRIASRAPFGVLVLLEGATRGPAVERIEAVDPFALLGSTFNLSVRVPERLTRHLDLAAALAATGNIYRVRVQPGIDATRLADAVLESVQVL